MIGDFVWSGLRKKIGDLDFFFFCLLWIGGGGGGDVGGGCGCGVTDGRGDCGWYYRCFFG